MSPDARSLTLLLRAQALQVLAQVGGGPPAAPVTVSETDGETSVVVSVAAAVDAHHLLPSGPPAKNLGKLTVCEADVLAVLRSADRPMVGLEVIAALAQRKKYHGDSTVLRALTRLYRAKQIGLSKRRPRGYFPPPF